MSHLQNHKQVKTWAYVPFEIQVEIIKKLPVKSLIRFTSVSRQWKSLIHSSEFITNHSVNQTQPHHLLIVHKVAFEYEYVSVVDDDSFPQHKFSHSVSPTVKLVYWPLMTSSSHGLVCLYGYPEDLMNGKYQIVLWNPSIRKSVGIVLPSGLIIYVGFGVCPKTSDPKIVVVTRPSKNSTSIYYKVEVFTLSSRAWRTIATSFPYKSTHFFHSQVVIDGVIHWLAIDNEGSSRRYQIISFDLTSEEFGEVDLPDCLACYRIRSVSNLNESLVVLAYCTDDARNPICDVWMMLNNGVTKSSFKKLFTVKSSDGSEDLEINGFRKNGQPIMKQYYSHKGCLAQELEVYEPCSEEISGIGICGYNFKTTSYTESLLLLNHSDSIIQ